MLVEIITLKLSLDFFEYLRKNSINCTDIKLVYFNRSRNRFMNFTNLDALKSFYSTNYTIYDRCQLGELVSIQSFRANSSLYNFLTNFIVTDVTSLDSIKIIVGSDFDRSRISTRQVFIDRQKTKILDTINVYKSYNTEIRNIYLNGIYSPCYAIPGYSEGTYRLEELRKLLNTTKSFT